MPGPRSRPDHSVLRPSIEVCKTGMKQAIQALKCGSDEVIDVLLNECDIIYECKVCFNLFRSLANFVSHKRSFCKSSCKTVLHHFHDPQQSLGNTTKLVVVEPESVETVFPEPGFELQDYSPSIELLKEAGIINEIEERPIVDSLLPTKHSQSKLSGIVKSLIAKRNAQESEDAQPPVLLEPLAQSSKAVFQTRGFSLEQDKKTMGQRYAELVKARQLCTAFVGPDNRVIEPGRATRSYSPTSSVGSSYAPPKSRPTSVGSGFPCLYCGNSYTRLYTTVHHLMKVHNISEARAQQDREKIKRLAENRKVPRFVREPKLVLKRLTRREIAQWTEKEPSPEPEDQSFKLALDSLAKNLTVSIPRLSPSKLENEANNEVEEGSETPKTNESDDEITFSNMNSPCKKRSRSSSPSSTSSSKEENLEKKPRTSSPCCPLPSASPRKVLSTKTDSNTPIKANRQSSNSSGTNKELKQLMMDAKATGVPLSRRALGTRTAGPASVMKRRHRDI